jgi:hypothetical protein
MVSDQWENKARQALSSVSSQKIILVGQPISPCWASRRRDSQNERPAEDTIPWAEEDFHVKS